MSRVSCLDKEPCEDREHGEDRETEFRRVNAIKQRREAPPVFVINLSLFALCLIWGSTWLVIKEGLEDLPPFLSAGVRFMVAALVMILVAPMLHRREGGDKPTWWLSTIQGITNFAVSYGIVYWCETILSSGLVCLLWAVFPMMMAVAAHVFLPSEKIRWREAMGYVIGFAGVALLFLTDVRSFGPSGIPVASILMISPAVAAVGTTLVKKYAENTSSVLLNRNGMTVGAVLLMVSSLITEGGKPVNWTKEAIAGIAYLSVIGTVVTFGLYFWLMRYTKASKLSLITYILPVVALFLGWALGGESIGLETLAGAFLVLAGISIALRYQGRTGASSPQGAKG